MRRLLLISLSAMAAAAGVAASDSPSMTATQLLDGFAKAQGRLKSFVAEYELSRQDEMSSPQPWKGSYTILGETRFDGRRIAERQLLWGRIVPGVEKAKDKPYYKSRLFDGHWGFQYEQPYWREADVPNKKLGAGTLTVRRVRPAPNGLLEALQFAGSGLLCWCGVLPHDSRAIDARLREASSVRVRGQLEPAGWAASPCHVLEADTPHGQYTVGLDPARDLQLAKAELRRQPGHQRSTSYTLTAGESDLSSVEKARFAQKDGIWFPVEVDARLNNAFTGGLRCSLRSHLKVTKLVVNPDHAVLRSFLPDDIRNRAAVYAEGGTNANGALISYRWQNGQVVDQGGRVFLTVSTGLIGLRNPANQRTAPPSSSAP
jgi:hypothetical protein